MERINPLIDVAFKMIFKEQDLLKDLLNSFLDFKIEEIQILDQEPTQKESMDEKQSFLDLKATTSDGKVINIEVQLNYQLAFAKRSSYYVSKLMTENFKISGDYNSLPKVLAINILNFKLFKETSVFKTHFVSYDIGNGITLQDAPEYYFIEMPKIDSERLSINNPFHRWLLFLEPDIQKEMYKEVLRMDKFISKAEERLSFISQDPKSKAEYDARFKQLTDEANRLKTAEKQGEEKERRKTSKALVETGMSYEEIEKILGYDPRNYI